ncbi:D-alanyl-D-alanine endopeptidase [Burkholderia sp. WAC0059]|uniref:D-alanyl-D-alanine endopeptidase n=1 Tax=Burkholderia sp. WAC0059 TaxID=2066022 RepID=UPI000C7E9C55|nr:D-alanyl-D-alanine endopeptidase [Burkholderia sp. WAC0059]PLZ02772.1 D-alanyl-D-alanine endopeptidase [Burkholderia sp. WAC0059]
MNLDKLLPFKVTQGAMVGTALSLAVSLIVSSALVMPVRAFAADDPAAAAPAGTQPPAAKDVVSGANAAGHRAGARKIATSGKARLGAKKRRVTYVMKGRRHATMRRVAFEPRHSPTSQAFRLHESPESPESLALRSNVAYIVDQNTLAPVYEKNSSEVVPIASISKLMTAMVVLDSKAPLDQPIEVTDDDRDFIKNTGSRLSVGSVLSREDMLHIALMASENRAAAALSRYYPGGRPAFIAAMNAKAKALGMTDTHFENSTGLTSHNVSTARDLVKMVNAAYQYPLIRQFSTDHNSYTVFTGKRSLVYNSTNALVHNPSWDIGLQKTGFINEAGECLVMQTTIHSRPMIVVLLDSTGKYSRFADASRVRTWLDNGGGEQQARVATGADANGAGT